MTLAQALEITGYLCDTRAGDLVAWNDQRPQPTNAEIIAEAEGIEAAMVPGAVPMAQFRRALRSNGIDPATIDAALAGNPDARDEWEYATEAHRDHPMIEEFRVTLGKTTEFVDQVFRDAATIGPASSQ